jgi:hypothetical protein
MEQLLVEFSLSEGEFALYCSAVWRTDETIGLLKYLTESCSKILYRQIFVCDYS